VLVHGDYFPGNVMIGGDLGVSGLVDFSAWTIAGDGGYDAVSALVFLEMIGEATPEDIALVRRVVLARHGDGAAQRRRGSTAPTSRSRWPTRPMPPGPIRACGRGRRRTSPRSPRIGWRSDTACGFC
jgi:aminoglycoside phosphotransferase (APT) family kinase protein